MKCIQCGVNVPDSAAFCPNCGSRLRSAVISPKPETFKFSCEICGQHISVPKVWSGRLAVCPSCNQRVRIPPVNSDRVIDSSAVRPLSTPPPAPAAEPPEAVPPQEESGAAPKLRAVPPPPVLQRVQPVAEEEARPAPVPMRVVPLPPPLPKKKRQPVLSLREAAAPAELPEEQSPAPAEVIPEVPAAVLAAGKRRNLMTGAAGIGILFCLLAVLGVVGVRLYRNAASSRPADLELFRRIGTACTIYCVDFQGAFPVGEGAVGFRRLVEQQCLERSQLLPEKTEFSEQNLKIAYVGGGLREGSVECGLLPVAFDKPRWAKKIIRVLRVDGTISLVEIPRGTRSCAEFAAFLRQSTPGPETAWGLILENARAIDFADGL